MAGPLAIVLNMLEAVALIRCDHLSKFNLLGHGGKLLPQTLKLPSHFFSQLQFTIMA